MEKGSSRSVCPSLLPDGYSYIDRVISVCYRVIHISIQRHSYTDISSYNSALQTQLPSSYLSCHHHSISLPTGTPDNRWTPTKRQLGEKDVLDPSHRGRSQITLEVQKAARNYLKQGQISVIVITSFASF